MRTRIACGKLHGTAFYRRLTIFLVCLMLLSGLAPLNDQAGATAIRQGSDPSSYTSATTSGVQEDSGPGAAVPSPSTKGQIVGKRRFSRTVSNGDGSYSATFSVRPLYWRDPKSKEWKDFDNRLVALPSDPDYAYQNDSNGYTVSFGKASGVVAGKPVMRVSSGSGSVKITEISAKPNDISVDGSKITYRSAYPNTDDEFVMDNERVKESVIIKSAAGLSDELPFVYKLDLDNLTPRQRDDGSVEFTDANGKVAFRMPAPFMEDANGVSSPSVSVSLVQHGTGSYDLTVSPDLSWLNDPSRAYPVALDPSVEQADYQPDETTGEDVTLNQDFPDSNYDYQSQLQVGKKSTGAKWDTMVRFPELDTLPHDSVIVDAAMKL